MIGGIIGAIVGRGMNRRNGRGGFSGAAVGMIAARVLSRMGPLGMILGGGYIAKQAYDRHRSDRRGPRG